MMNSGFAAACLAWVLPAWIALPASATSQDAPDVQVPAETITRPVGASEVSVSEFMTVDVVAQNDYLTNVLQKLAIQSRRNIVPSGKSERLITANIYGAPFEEALTGLLEPNGLGYVARGDFLFVYTIAELEAMEVGGFGAVSRILHLNYLRAEDARTYAASMLSSKGSIEVSRDLIGQDAGADAAGAAATAGGGGSVRDNDIYSPEHDEFDLRNAIIVHDRPERIDRIEEFLRSIDTRPAQLLLEVSIVQTSLTEQTAFGVDFALLGDEDFVDFFRAPVAGQTLDFMDVTNPVTSVTAPIAPSSNDAFVTATPGNVGRGGATIRAGYVGNVGVFMRALDQVTDVTLLSNPKVMTLNRQRAKVFVGERIGYFETTTVETQVLQSLKTIDTGIILDIRPFVLDDGRIRLKLSPKISQVSFRQVAAPQGGTQDIPDEQVQSVTTDILVPEGYTAVLGGLFREDTTRSRNQVPFLGDLPLIGPLFQGRDDELQQTEVIFLIKVTVLDDRTVGKLGAEGAEHREHVRVGSRLGLLPWSRERHSASLNLAAERALVRGDVERARWNLRRSLGMHPAQPGVVRAIEQLDDKKLWIRDLSLVNRMIDEQYAERNAATGVGEEED